MPVPSVLVLLADGFEEIEAVTPIDILRRAGADVTLASLGDGIHVTGRCGLILHANTTLAMTEGAEFDCLLVPGGPGVAGLRSNQRVISRVKNQEASGRWIAAICAAPTLLNDAGILEGRRYTAHPSVMTELPNVVIDEKVVIDGSLVTSRGAGTALDFGLMLVEKLFSKEKALEVARSICA